MKKSEADAPEQIAPGEIIICGEVTYEGAPESHARAHVAIVNYEYLALLFPVDATHGLLLKTTVEDRDPADNYQLETYLMAPLMDHVHAPFLHVVAESFEEPEVVDTWGAAMGYTVPADPADKPMRALVLYPPKGKGARPHNEYVLPLLTRTREKGPTLKIEFGRS